MDFFESIMESPWVMMTLGLATHLLFKAIRVKDTSKRNEEKFNARVFLSDYVAPFLISLIASFMATYISIDKEWPLWSAYFMSMASSSAIYNIYPAITNPNLWKSVAGMLTSKVVSGSNNNEKTGDQ